VGGKYNGDNGFDHVFQNPDMTVTILVDSKQIVNGKVVLSNGAGGYQQLTEAWIDEVLEQLDPNSPAAAAIINARANGTLVKAVAGVERNTQSLTILRVQ
jgi:hypothetical protein